MGFFFALFTEKKQTLHDLLADTFVVYGKNQRSIADAWIENVRNLFRSVPHFSNKSTLSQLERLQALRDQGALTEQEFQEQKRKILGS